MKHFFLIIFTLLISVSTSAANAEKNFKKLVGKYDVADEAKWVANYHPAEFWKATLYNDESLIKLVKDLKKGKGAEKEAFQKLAQINRFYPQYEQCIVEDMQGFCDTLLIDMGIADLNLKCSLYMVNSDDVNAYTVLTEDGFAMCITSGLFLHKGITYEMLMGFVAHEFAHGALMHHLRSLYAEAKERRKNELLGGIAAGLNVVAAGANAYTSALTGTEYDSSTYANAIDRIGEEIKISTLNFTFKFSREEEYESDLVAFRFLQNIGKSEALIDGLKLLGTEYDNLYSEYSDHPTIPSRIAFLQFLNENPQLGNTENAKLHKKRAKSN
jgi:hypothetical protein